MIEVTITGIQISLTSRQHWVVLLKALESERYLAIWIGPYEAEAINLELQGIETPRPLTHDLLKNTIYELGGIVQYIVINDLRDITIDARPSDSMALAVRTRAPIYVAEKVMDEAGIVPEQDMSKEGSAFDEFLRNLDIDDLPIQ